MTSETAPEEIPARFSFVGLRRELLRRDAVI
jgi:hypothetical protein